MNLWLMAACGAALALVPCAVMCLHGPPDRRLVGLEMTGLTLTITLVLLTVGFGRLPFIDLAVALAILSFGGGLVFARFLEKHL
jgi:multisubunit Na+/H+ antiporter MnhF subunit